MKVKKKTAMLVSFALGTLLLATTAFADIATKSGYDQLKDTLKVTAENCSDKFNSFTMEFSFEVKDNGKTLENSIDTSKHDRSKSATESISYREGITRDKYKGRSYSDNTSDIRYSDTDPIYYVTEFSQERKQRLFTNPFKENRAEDLEKIADALVGSLKDYVVVTDNPDGSKDLSGSLTEVQIPSLVNALASFQLKQELSGGANNPLPHLTKDIFVKEVTGIASINKDGVMEKILGTAVLSGKDEQGLVHDVSVEILVKLTDINSTTVSKPDLTGKKVVKQTANPDYSSSEITNPQKFVGKFKNNILIEKDGKYVKIGERFIEITNIDNKTVTGKYYEVYKPGFEEYATQKHDFSFNAQFDKDQPNAKFVHTDESGNNIQGIFFDQHDGRLNLNGSSSSIGGLISDYSFSPDLE